MMHLDLSFDPISQLPRLDLTLNDRGLPTNTSQDALKSAVLLSIFPHARNEDAPFLQQRGWWGDALLPEEGDSYGSQLWIYERQLITDNTAKLFKNVLENALAWLIDDGVVDSIDIETEALPTQSRLNYSITLTQNEEVTTFQF